MFLSKFSLLLGSILILSSCTTSPDVASAQSQTSIDTRNAPVGFAILYIYRPENRIKRMVTYDISLNGKTVASLGNSTHTVIYIKPGKYNVSTSTAWYSMSLAESNNIQGTFTIPSSGKFYLKFDRSYGPAVPGQPYTINYERWTLLPSERALPEISETEPVSPDIKKL